MKRNGTDLFLIVSSVLGGLVIVTDFVAIRISRAISGLAPSVALGVFLQFSELPRCSVLPGGPISIVAVISSISIQI